jgi:hypothetical protein
MNPFIERINCLPIEVVNSICKYLPLHVVMWLNKELYLKNHAIVKHMISRLLYDNYIRDMIRKDNDFIFLQILSENADIFDVPKIIVYKRISYPNYFAFINDFCILNKSAKCRTILLELTGLSQNQHKKNRYLNIRWKI